MVLMQHCRIDPSLLQHQSTSEEKHGRLLKRGSGYCRTFLCSVTQVSIKTLLKRGRGDYRTLPCSVSEQLKTRAERHGRPELSPVGLDI